MSTRSFAQKNFLDYLEYLDKKTPHNSDEFIKKEKAYYAGITFTVGVLEKILEDNSLSNDGKINVLKLMKNDLKKETLRFWGDECVRQFILKVKGDKE